MTIIIIIVKLFQLHKFTMALMPKKKKKTNKQIKTSELSRYT